MIQIPGLKRKQIHLAEEQSAASEGQQKPKRGRPARFLVGIPETTRDLLGGHDGGRVGYRKPLQG